MALLLQWQDPESPNGNISHYNYSCLNVNGSQISRNGGVSSLDFSVTIAGLFPFTEYQCNVTASTSGGTSDPGTNTSVTGQAGNSI